MKNCEIKTEGHILTVKIDLSKTMGASRRRSGIKRI